MSSSLFSLCTFWAFVLLSHHALLSAPLLLGELFFFPPLSNAFPWPLTQLLLSGAFPPALRAAQGPAIQRRFAFPLPVYSISDYAQLATKRLHAPFSLTGLFLPESLWVAVSFFSPLLQLVGSDISLFHCHDFKEKQAILIFRWKPVDFAAVVSDV